VHGARNVPAGRLLTDKTHIVTGAGERDDTISERFRRYRRAGEKKARPRIGWSENLDRAPKRAVILKQGNDRDPERQGAPVCRVVNGREFLDPIELVVERKCQGAGILAIDATGRELAPAANFLPAFITQQASCSFVDVSQGSLMIEDDHRFAEAIEHLEPRSSYEILCRVSHASITA
jgi:hypothetical protein